MDKCVFMRFEFGREIVCCDRTGFSWVIHVIVFLSPASLEPPIAPHPSHDHVMPENVLQSTCEHAWNMTHPPTWKQAQRARECDTVDLWTCMEYDDAYLKTSTGFYTKGRPLVKSNLICPSDKLSWQPGCPVLNINIQGNFCISKGNGSSDNLPKNLV